MTNEETLLHSELVALCSGSGQEELRGFEGFLKMKLAPVSIQQDTVYLGQNERSRYLINELCHRFTVGLDERVVVPEV